MIDRAEKVTCSVPAVEWVVNRLRVLRPPMSPRGMSPPRPLRAALSVLRSAILAVAAVHENLHRQAIGRTACRLQRLGDIRRHIMDLAYLGLTVGFFAVSWVMVELFDRL